MRRLTAVLCALTLLAGACGGGDDESASVSTPGDETTTTGPGGEGSEGGDGKTPTPASIAPGAGAKAQPGSAPPVPQPPANEQAPRDGRYQYSVTATDDKGQQQQATQILTVKTDSRGQVVRQTHRLAAGGRDTVTTLEWRPDGLWLVSQRAEEGGSSSPECDWNPDTLEWPLPFRVGATWTSESTCATGSVSRTVKLSGKVARTETVKVAGKNVDTVVLERTRDERVTLDGVPIDSTTTTTDWISVDRGLIVRSTATVKGTAGLSSGSSDRRLDNFDPV